jgi:hypothetical protein
MTALLDPCQCQKDSKLVKLLVFMGKKMKRDILDFSVQMYLENDPMS